MKNWTRWSAWTGCGALLAAASVVGFNVVVDPYSVLGTGDWMRQGYNVNERFAKVEHLRKDGAKYDSFILGSSTMGLYEVAPANEMRPGSSWYNLAFLAGTPPEALRALKFLKSNGQEIKEVMYGIDIFAFRKVEGSREMWKREHPLVKGEAWWDWYKAHLFASSFLIGMDRIEHQLRPQPKMMFDIDGTGRYHLLDWDREIAKDRKAFTEKMIYAPIKKRGGKVEESSLVLIKERFDELKALKSWLEENGIKAHFWINPMQWATLKSIDGESLADFRKRVEESIGEVPDYSLRKEFTDNDDAFYEAKHYTPGTAALITREILGCGGGCGSFSK